MIRIEPIASGSGGNAYYISDGATNILIECGVSLRTLKEWCYANKHNYRTLDCVLVSHSHKDHSRSAQVLLDMGIKGIMPKDTIKELGIRWAIPIASYPDTHNAEKVNNWSVYAFPLVHDVTTYAYVIDIGAERLHYITDTKKVLYNVNKVTHLMIECNHDTSILDENAYNGEISVSEQKRITNTHMNINCVKTAIMSMDRSRLKEIWLLHLSDRNADEKRFRKEIQELVDCPVYIA